jgi:hypothetical protein
VGQRQAQENTRKMGVTWIQKVNRTPCYRKRTFKVPLEQRQLFSMLPACGKPNL